MMGVLLGNQGQHREALPYLEKAAELGHPHGAQYAAQVRQMLGETPTSPANSTQQAFDAFQQAASPVAMTQAVAQYPFMADDEFMATVEQVINQQVPPEQQPAFQSSGWPGCGRLPGRTTNDPTQPRYQPGDKIGGRYQVHKALMGGMGEVYLPSLLSSGICWVVKKSQESATERMGMPRKG